MLRHKRTLKLSNEDVKFQYNWLSGVLSVTHDGITLYKKMLWKPYSKIKLEILEDQYVLKVLLIPLSSFLLSRSGGNVVCSNLFPKLRRYSIITFTLSLIKRLALLLAAAFS